MFIKEFVRIVLGKKVWKNNSYCSNLSEYCLASGKAFCLLVVENNYEQWTDMVGSGDQGNKNNSAPAPVYTNAGKSNRKNGATKPFQGWTAEGYKQFDVLYTMVRADHAQASRNSFKEELKRMMMEEFSRKRQAKADDLDDGEAVVYPSHDFDNVMKGGITPPESMIHGEQPTHEEASSDKASQPKINHFVDGEGEDNDRESDEDDNENKNGKF
jgi:hypothetical protein